MVTHQTASPITAKACGRSLGPTLPRRSVVSRIAIIAHPRALASDRWPPALPCSQFSVPHCCRFRLARFQFSRFHATRHRAEQKRACSRFGANSAPQRAHLRPSAIYLMLRVTRSVDSWARLNIAGTMGGQPANARFAVPPSAPEPGSMRQRRAGQRDYRADRAGAEEDKHRAAAEREEQDERGGEDGVLPGLGERACQGNGRAEDGADGGG